MMSPGRFVCTAVAVAMLAACASEAGATRESDQMPVIAAIAEPVEAIAKETTTPTPSDDFDSSGEIAANDQESEIDMTSSTDGDAAEPTATAATPSPAASAEPTATAQQCVRLTDFATDAETQAWFVVNDNVMGGQSSGGPTFVESAMVFEGVINTDGGGFSSVRLELGSNTLTGFSELRVRARTDGRPYKITLEDSLETRDRRVSQQGALRFAATSDWQTVQVPFADLQPKIFGRDVQTEAFRPDLATQLGVMISDSVDGPFRIEIDWIDACE